MTEIADSRYDIIVHGVADSRGDTIVHRIADSNGHIIFIDLHVLGVT